MAHRELVDISVGLQHETEKAWLVDDGKVKVWIPKSQGEIILNANKKTWTLTIPEWLAMETGLI